MKSLQINQSKGLNGEIHIPGDKSTSHRAVMIGSLAGGRTKIDNFLPSADCLATVDCFRKLGIEINLNGNQVEVFGKGLRGLKPSRETLDVGNSGTTIRLISGILAGQNFKTIITGDKSIQRRPMARIVKPLRSMGASIEGRRMNNEIFAPLKISGGDLKPINYELPVASAQVKSAILLAGLFAEGETVVIEKNPSRDHTERMLSHFGAKIQGTRIRGNREFSGADIDMPGDLSSASFLMAAALLVSDSLLLIREVGVNPTRTGIIDILHRMGANLEVKDERMISEEPRAEILVRSSKLRAVKISGEIVPRIIDEIPIIAVAATQAEGLTEIRGARELRVKESDRIATISSELKKMGADIQELEDGMFIVGPTKLKGTTVKSYGDHRIAMAMAIAGLIAEGETVVEDTECIETSFPGFEKVLRTLED